MSPCAVAQDLHLDVAGAAHVAFEEDRIVAEGRAGFAPRLGQPLANSAALRTTRMPRPPPPKAALTISGKPMRRATRSAWRGSAMGSSVPGTVGMPARCASWRAARLVAQQFEQLARWDR